MFNSLSIDLPIVTVIILSILLLSLPRHQLQSCEHVLISNSMALYLLNEESKDKCIRMPKKMTEVDFVDHETNYVHNRTSPPLLSSLVYWPVCNLNSILL